MSSLPVEIVSQVGLGALRASFHLVTDGRAVLLHQMVLETLLASEEPVASATLLPGDEGTEAEFPAASASLRAHVSLPVRVPDVAALAIVGAVHEA